MDVYVALTLKGDEGEISNEVKFGVDAYDNYTGLVCVDRTNLPNYLALE